MFAVFKVMFVVRHIALYGRPLWVWFMLIYAFIDRVKSQFTII